MKTVGDVMIPHPPVASPQWSVRRAAEVMERVGLRCLPVLEGAQLVGLVTDRQLIFGYPNRLVADVMRRDFCSVLPDQSLWEARSAIRDGHDFLAVQCRGRLVGIISRERIELELARYVCPLTELPRGELLKSRAAELIRQGHEVAVIFLDMDDFGLVNKDLGHVVGDRVLQEVSALLRSLTHPERDVLGRYGGDEFAVVTLRPLPEAEMLAGAMVEAVERRRYGPEAIPLSASAGVAGGRRQTARGEGEAGWTVDDLFNLASLASTRAKRAGRPVAVATGHVVAQSRAMSV